MNTKTLKGKVITGIIWNTVQLIVNRSFSFVIKLVLAKILFPEQFGLVGMAAVFTSFVQVFNDLGFGAALVQRKEEDLREEHYHTSFWTGITWSIALYILIALIVAPLAAEFYKEPVMEQIIPVLSLGVLASPINLVHRAQLTKQLDFRRLTYISNFSSIFSGILSLILAFSGFGVWALVFNSVATFVVAMPMYFKATRWKPKLIWQKEAFTEIFGFGVNTMGTQVFNNLISKFDYLIIGKLLSASALGVYTLAFTLTDTFRGQLMSVMNTVMYPIYGKKQDDVKSLTLYYLKVVEYNAIIIYPIMMVMMLFASPIISGFFGEKWLDAIIPVQILSVSVVFHLMVSSNTSLIRGMGKPGLEFKLQLFKSLVLYVPLIFLGTKLYGTVGAAMAILINKVLSVFIAQYYLKKLLNISFSRLLIAIKPSSFGLILGLGVGYLLYFKLKIFWPVSAAASLMIYTLIVYLMIGKELLHQVRSFRNQKM
ncbi:O-antigen/teichoic acid export membrane protein [Pontibacter mucosus]|uniref:O-antigen/teichoic acid export membrane protein n=1 Tax=Pontibacter mucosus TaxID=1649266 RepID=A0A2T5Y3C2_9BACT|nr:lipopolysaccharide biosynthesis protein [Pontibacter mucosus]PTX10673.1 O-antigen/teichoic acid export membrane protein [Pontibacter mucosus]